MTETAGARILIVEDERITAEDVHEILEGHGYTVSAVVSSGPEAVHEAQKNPPDLVLMDIRINGPMDGADTAKVLRDLLDIPVLFLTAHADRDTLQRAKRAVPAGYLVKPFHEAELYASVEMALHRQRFDRHFRGKQKHLTQVLHAMVLGIVSVDVNGHVVVFNRAAERLTGWEEGEALYRPVRTVFRVTEAQSGEEVDVLRDARERGDRFDLTDMILLTRTGKRIPVQGNVVPVHDAHRGYAGAVVLFEAASPQRSDPPAATRRKIPERPVPLEFGEFQVIAASANIRQTFAFAQRVARSEASVVLVEGESGTGKDLIAQFLHYSGNRSTKPFVPINCSTIPETLLESELFGYEPGAFSDARGQKKGLFEIANGGTLFLDEIGEMSRGMQAKLLRVLESQTFRRLGGLRDIVVDVRVVSATNRFLAEEVRLDKFRLDLFHRLSIIQINVPPLRERREDILPLAEHFIKDFSRKYKVSVTGLTVEAAHALEDHPWPGNIRELRNVIERAVLSETSGNIQLERITFVQGTLGVRAGTPGDLSLKNSQRILIQEAVAKTGGNKTKAAALLGISRDVLRYRINKLNLGKEE